MHSLINLKILFEKVKVIITYGEQLNDLEIVKDYIHRNLSFNCLQQYEMIIFMTFQKYNEETLDKIR